ncbi:alpha/beta fold hydrolase [Serratia fonticola]|uniref:alpha/beta fold hydrolase n=1 Tax=Serratia fonticola TaxID=47917 RepID=UPI0034C68A06
MLYSLFYPLMTLLAYGHQKYHWCLVVTKRRPKLLLQTVIRPESHYHRQCTWLKKTDIELLSRFSVALAARYTLRLFERPTRMPCLSQDLAFEEQSPFDEFCFLGLKVRVYRHEPEVSNGKTLLLLHGWEGRSVMFRPLIAKLLHQGYRLILPDLLAHGHSEGSRCSFYELSSFILELDRKYGSFEAAIGHSFGGTALAIALEQGLELNKMVTIGSPNGFGNMIDAYIDYFRYPSSLKAQLKRIYTHQQGKSPDDIGPPLWGRLNLPTLICHDSNDVVINIQEAHDMHASFPNSQLCITSGMGHRGVLRDNQLHAAILSFL